MDWAESEPDIADVFWQVARNGNSVRERFTFIRYWQACSEGVDPTSNDFQARLAEEIRQRFG